MLFGNCRSDKRAGSVLLLTNPKLRLVLSANIHSILPSNGKNIYAVDLQNFTLPTTLIAVYRPPNVNTDDRAALLFDCLNAANLLPHFSIVEKNFNIILYWRILVILCA